MVKVVYSYLIYSSEELLKINPLSIKNFFNEFISFGSIDINSNKIFLDKRESFLL